nr:AIF_HP1_G0030570.mRNA.1.CDS.1 [Saccharomyces cerevisiae]
MDNFENHRRDTSEHPQQKPQSHVKLTPSDPPDPKEEPENRRNFHLGSPRSGNLHIQVRITRKTVPISRNREWGKFNKYNGLNAIHLTI